MLWDGGRRLSVVCPSSVYLRENYNFCVSCLTVFHNIHKETKMYDGLNISRKDRRLRPAHHHVHSYTGDQTGLLTVEAGLVL